MLSGRHVGAAEAAKLGLVDRVVDGTDPLAAGLAYAQELVQGGAPVRRRPSPLASLALDIAGARQNLQRAE